MITKSSKIGVTSRTFCRSQKLRDLLEKDFSNVAYNDDGIHFDNESLVSFLGDCDAAIVSGENLSKEIIDQLPKLKIVSKFGVGLDGIDTSYLEEKDIKLAWKPGINSTSVAELALCYLILLLREADSLNRDLISGVWSKVKNSRDLSESTIGIIGYGQIGKKLSDFLEVHQTRILVYDPFLDSSKTITSNIEIVELNFLLRESDAITLHLPLSDDTKHLISNSEIKLMKKDSVLINLSRGGIVDEKALYSALVNNKIAGAAIDVFELEPGNNPELVSLSNVFATPHIAGTSRSASRMLGLSAINGLVESIDN